MSENNDYDNEALARLDPSELSKYISALEYYVGHPYEAESLVLATGNSCELSDNLPKINNGYTEDMVKPLQEILSLIEKTLPLIRDKTLSAMLEDNRKEILSFFSKFSIEPSKDSQYTYSEKTSNPYYRDYKAARDYVKNKLSEEKNKLPCDQTRQLYADIGEGLKYLSENNIRSQRPDIDTFIEEGLARYRERKHQWSMWEGRKGTEELCESDPKRYFRETVLPRLVDKIVKDGLR